jgi:hypothetical protein
MKMDSFSPKHGEVPWLEDLTGTVCGSIVRGRTKRNWGYVILRRSPRGEFRICEVANGFGDWREAELQLILAIDASAGKQKKLTSRRGSPVAERPKRQLPVRSYGISSPAAGIR